MSGHIRGRGERSWELKYETGTDPGTGRRLTKYRNFKGTKREAQAELVRLMDTVPALALCAFFRSAAAIVENEIHLSTAAGLRDRRFHSTATVSALWMTRCTFAR